MTTILSSLNRFKIFFTGRFPGKFAVKCVLKIPPHLAYVATQTHTHRHAHTRLTAPFPGLPGWAGTRKAKPNWILLKQETVNGSGISWAIMQVCTSFQTDNHASTSPLRFLQAGCPSCRPTNSVKALKATVISKFGYIQK